MSGLRLASGVLCDKKEPPKLKGKVYKVVVRPTMLYGAECWPVKKSHVQKIKVTEMRMRDKNLNEDIRDKVGVASVVDKTKEARLRWFRHVKKRSVDASRRKCERLAIVGVNTGRGKLKRSCLATNKEHEGWNFHFRRFLNDWKMGRLAEFLATVEPFQGLDNNNRDKLIWKILWNKIVE
ncbi:hypothetical protein H5410_037017 [Solanum commersonii]|uniref:Uncharacterized protein n=1 Tax=Solanum commersonii TaxID=4109 RepID=A0A9J5Y5Y6_SOLCO|nr:hypothetical protein H5410_037017 [Solanum commersonii]